MAKTGGLLCAVAALLAACGSDDGPSSPYGDIEVARDLDAPGLSHPVDIVRDANGTPHIWARSVEDAAFALGYVEAADRLPMMDLVRHAALGRSAELAGGLDRSIIEIDLFARAHAVAQRADASVAQLEASSDPLDQEVLAFLQRICDGINLFGAQLQSGEYVLDGPIRIFYNEELFTEFTPRDLIAVALFGGLQSSYSEKALELTRAYETARATFDDADPVADPALAARAGAYHDLWSMRAVDPTSTIDGFQRATLPAERNRSSTVRPRVPAELLRRVAGRRRGPIARRLLPGADHSNNWAVGSALTGGAAILANDPHGDLENPNRMAPVHITVPDEIDVWAIAWYGYPIFTIGFNRDVAWGITTSNFDVTDFYLEQIAPCSGGAGDCVAFDGGEVPIEVRQETIGIGTLGTITDSITVDVEIVPHHGPILFELDEDGLPLARTGSTAISARYAGDQVSQEMRAAYRLLWSTNVAGALEALEDLHQGNFNIALADSSGDVGWTAQEDVPWLDPGCFSYDADTNPDGVAPWFVIPGDGSCEWGEQFMDRDLVPHAIAPAKGWIATANADPTGATADGDPLDDGDVDGRPLYVGWYFEPGYRIGRITRLIEGLIGDGDLTVELMAEIQTDDHSNYGARMLPHLAAALTAFAEERAAPGTHPNLETWAAGLDAAAAARLTDAAARLDAWSLHTPSGVDAANGSAEAADSIATAIFSAWIVHFVDEAFDDELALLGERLVDGDVMGRSRDISRTALAVFERPDELRSGLSATTGEPVLCDDLDTAGTEESCTLVALIAMDRALSFLAGPDAMGTDDVDAWRWGTIHRVTLTPLIPSRDLEVPAPGEPAGLPQGGDQFAVDNADFGYDDLDFSQNHGPDIRLLVELETDGPKARLALAGGTVFDTFSPHYRDLLPGWLDDRYEDIPFETDEILAAAEERWHLE